MSQKEASIIIPEHRYDDLHDPEHTISSGGACMDPIDITGWVATIVTIMYTSYGLPVQFYKNYKKKSTEGLSPGMIVMMFLTFLSWVMYAAIKSPPDLYILVCNSIGAVWAFIILIQFWIYRTPHDKTI